MGMIHDNNQMCWWVCGLERVGVMDVGLDVEKGSQISRRLVEVSMLSRVNLKERGQVCFELLLINTS